MADIDADVVILGWGKGGKTLAGALGRAGRSVVLVEHSSTMYGGSCININCVPTKMLVRQAETRPERSSAREWFTESVDRRDTLVEKLRDRNHAMLAEVETVTLVDGHARFIGPRRVEVRAGTYRLVIDAGAVVVNTGSVPVRPPVDGLADSTRVYDSTTLQHVEPLPGRLVIVGGGYVGLEVTSVRDDSDESGTTVTTSGRAGPGRGRCPDRRPRVHRDRRAAAHLGARCVRRR